jgi:galactonate dehydratase
MARDALTAAARETVAEGYTMLRLEPFRGHHGPELAEALEGVRAIREAVGDDVDLVVAGHPGLSAAAAETLAAALAPLEPLWIEDLVAAWPLEPLEWISQRLNQPLAGGRGARPDVLRELARTSLIDHLVVDVGRVGGLLEARRLAALAEIYHTGVIATGSGGPVSLRDALQLAAVLPNLTAVEVPRGLARIESGAVEVTR